MLLDISVDTSIYTLQKIHDHNTDLPGSVCNVTSFFLKTPKVSFTLKVGKWENCIVSTCTRLCSKKIVGSPQDQTDKGFGSMMTITILNSSAKANISLPANNPKNYICNKVHCLGPLRLDITQAWSSTVCQNHWKANSYILDTFTRGRYRETTKTKGYSDVNSLPTESVLVVKDLGIQLTRIGAFGLQTSQFIGQHRVVDVIINEVITMVCTILFMSQSLNNTIFVGLKSSCFDPENIQNNL